MMKSVLEKLVAMACPPKPRRRRVQFAKKSGADFPVCPSRKSADRNVCATFLEELIDACVLELYFPDEALGKDLQFITATAVCLEKRIGLESEKSIREFIGHCIARSLGEKLARLESDSSDLFAVIKQEGKV
jgi:adenine-specific DNA-methyltransferase